MNQTNDEKRDEVILDALLDHPYLHGGITAEAAWNYLLGRMHHSRHQEKWRESSRKLAFWLKSQGFISVRSGSVNKYHWVVKDNTTSEE